MPAIDVILFQEADGTVPFVDWLDDLPAVARDRCLARLSLLQKNGHKLRRPVADYVAGTDLYELRVKY